jgi:hypothetical protein
MIYPTQDDPANLYTTNVILKVSKNHIGGVNVSRIALSVVDRGSNRRVSKNRIGGVKVSRIALSVVDRGSNRRVSKNHIGGVKVSRIALSPM